MHKQNSSRTAKTTARISNDSIAEALGKGDQIDARHYELVVIQEVKSP
jgi:hypothetical protein